MKSSIAHFALASCLLALLAVPALAQTAEEDEELFLEQAEVAQTQLSPDDAREAILQRLHDGQHVGILNSFLTAGLPQGGNFALINQEGVGNTASILQEGMANLAVMHQEGNRNTNVLEQIGTGNIFGSWFIGDDNHLTLRQQGNDNVYILEFEGSGRNFGHSVEQIGDGIQAIQIGAAERPFSIEQYGSGMEIRIEHNR